MPSDPQPSSVFSENDVKLTREEFLARLDGVSTANPEAAPAGEGPTDSNAEIAELLATPDSEQSPPATPLDPVQPAKTLDGLAEQLGVELKDLYALEIPMRGDGENRTLGQLKDTYDRESDYEARNLELEERRVTQDKSLLRAKQDLQEIMAGLPKDALSPEVLAKAHVQADTYRRNESQRLHELVPEWADETLESDERAGIAEQLAGYGFPAAHLESVADHRLIMYMRDNYLRAERVKAALAKVEVKKPKPRAQQPSTRTDKPRTGQPARPAPAKSTTELRRTFAGLNRG